jgi:hypothetical protein
MSISVWKQSLQIAKRSLSNFYEISVISFCTEIIRRSYALSTLLYTPNAVPVDFSVETIPANRKTQSFKFLRNLCHFVPIEILRHINALSTPLYTFNVLHLDFSVDTISASRKTQSFKFRRRVCYFVPDWEVSTFKGSFHSILHAERIACRFQCRNNLCKSEKAIFQISTKSLSFRSGLRYYGI